MGSPYDRTVKSRHPALLLLIRHTRNILRSQKMRVAFAAIGFENYLRDEGSTFELPSNMLVSYLSEHLDANYQSSAHPGSKVAKQIKEILAKSNIETTFFLLSFPNQHSWCRTGSFVNQEQQPARADVKPRKSRVRRQKNSVG